MSLLGARYACDAHTYREKNNYISRVCNIRTTSIEIELQKRRVIFKHHFGLNTKIYDDLGRIVCCTWLRLMNRTGFQGDTYRTTERFRKNKQNKEQKDDKPHICSARIMNGIMCKREYST